MVHRTPPYFAFMILDLKLGYNTLFLEGDSVLKGGGNWDDYRDTNFQKQADGMVLTEKEVSVKSKYRKQNALSTFPLNYLMVSYQWN